MGTTTNPLFVDIDTLKARLRMATSSGLGTFASEVVEGFVGEVRLLIYQALGTETVATLLAQQESSSPTSQEQLNRSAATVLEVEWVRLLLMQRGDIFTKESLAAGRQTFQDEGGPRPSGAQARDAMISRQQAVVDSWISYLTEGPSSEIGSSLQVSTIGPEEAFPPPGFSVQVGDGLGPE